MLYKQKPIVSKKKKKIFFPYPWTLGQLFSAWGEGHNSPFSASLKKTNSTYIRCASRGSQHFRDITSRNTPNHLMRQVTITSPILHLKLRHTELK